LITGKSEVEVLDSNYSWCQTGDNDDFWKTNLQYNVNSESKGVRVC